MEFNFANFEPNGVKINFENDPPIRAVYSRMCVSGEGQTIEGICNVCPVNTYLLEGPENALDCNLCQSNSYCYGRNQIAPKPGHYRKSLISETIPCKSWTSCLGGNKDDLLGKCNEGYFGMLCGGCITGWYKKNWKYCENCPNFYLQL